MSSLMSLFGSLMGNNNNNVDDNEALSREHQCANCGKGEEEDNVHLKKCNGFKMVKYCASSPAQKGM